MSSRVLFRPRSYQLASRRARAAGANRFVESLHRRAGKDRNWLNFSFLESLQRIGPYIHVLPNLNQARRDVWNNVVHETIDGRELPIRMRDFIPPELLDGKDEGEMFYRIKGGSTWQLCGADDDNAIDRLRGMNAIGIVLSEYGSMNPKVWDVLEPVVMENRGWVAFIGTPKGKNHFYRLYNYAIDEMSRGNQKWFAQLKTARDTRRDGEGEQGGYVIDPEEIEDLKRRPDVRPEFIEQEYYCSWEGYSLGTIYGDLIAHARSNQRVGLFPHNPALPVGLCFDLGVSDDTSVWFYQRIDKAIVFIDYHEEALKGPEWWAHFLRERKRYTYGRINLPWDGRGHAAYFNEVGFQNINVAERPVSLAKAIDDVRLYFPQFYFNESTTQAGLHHLDMYAYDRDDEANVFSKKPVHDKHSHAADALRSGVACGFGPLLYEPQFMQPIKVETQFDVRNMPSQWGRR